MLFTLATVSSCSSDEPKGSEDNNLGSKTITLNATINNGTDSRVTYNDNGTSMTVSWGIGESFNVCRGSSGFGGAFKIIDGTNTFVGGVPEGGTGKYYAVYPSDITNAAGVLTIDLTEQTGTVGENGIKEFMLAEATELNSSTTLTFDHKLAVLKITLTLPNDPITPVSKISVDGLHNKA